MVPDGWMHTTFDKHIDCLTGFAFKSDSYSFADNDIRLLRGDNIEPGGLRWRDAKLWPKNELDDLNKYQLQEGDFVIALDRTWISSGLKVAEVTSKDLPCLLVQRVARVRAKQSLEQSLLRQYFSGHRFEQYVKSVQTATAVPHISPNNIKEFTLLLPTLPEQKKIAQILSTWDQAIIATERLLENSQQRKKGLMQQLLTGKKRLPGFEGEWTTKAFGSLGSTYPGLSGKTKEDFGTGEPFVTYMGVFSDGEISPDRFDYVQLDKGESQHKVQYGDVLFTTSSETPEEVGMASVLLERLPYSLYLNSFCFGFRLNSFEELVPEYARYLFRGEEMRRRISALAQGATRYNLSKKQLLKLDVLLPESAEQKAIACTLAISDKEISAIKRRLDYLIIEKKALMQQLLTGKRRVQVEAA